MYQIGIQSMTNKGSKFLNSFFYFGNKKIIFLCLEVSLRCSIYFAQFFEYLTLHILLQNYVQPNEGKMNVKRRTNDSQAEVK